MPSTCQQIKTQYEELQRQTEVFKVAYGRVKTVEDLKEIKVLKKQYENSLDALYAKIDPFQMTTRERRAKLMNLDFVGPFSPKGIAPARKGKDWIFISRQGSVLESFGTFQSATSFKEGFSLVQDQGKFFYVSEDGVKMPEVGFDRAKPFSEGLALIEIDTDYFFINKEGKKVPNLGPFGWADSFSEGLAPNDDGRDFHFINKHGDVMEHLGEYIAIGNFSEGLAWVFLNLSERWFCIDKQGVKDEYLFAHSQVEPFSHGLSRVGDSSGLFFIDKRGVAQSETYYEEAFSYSEGLALVRKTGGLYYFIDLNGQKVDSLAEFDEAKSFVDGCAEVKKNNRTFFVDKKGRELFKK